MSMDDLDTKQIVKQSLFKNHDQYCEHEKLNGKDRKK